jgi:hypothetical protein
MSPSPLPSPPTDSNTLPSDVPVLAAVAGPVAGVVPRAPAALAPRNADLVGTAAQDVVFTVVMHYTIKSGNIASSDPTLSTDWQAISGLFHSAVVVSCTAELLAFPAAENHTFHLCVLPLGADLTAWSRLRLCPFGVKAASSISVGTTLAYSPSPDLPFGRELIGPNLGRPRYVVVAGLEPVGNPVAGYTGQLYVYWTLRASLAAQAAFGLF